MPQSRLRPQALLYRRGAEDGTYSAYERIDERGARPMAWEEQAEQELGCGPERSRDDAEAGRQFEGEGIEQGEPEPLRDQLADQ